MLRKTTQYPGGIFASSSIVIISNLKKCIPTSPNHFDSMSNWIYHLSLIFCTAFYLNKSVQCVIFLYTCVLPFFLITSAVLQASHTLVLVLSCLFYLLTFHYKISLILRI